MDHRPLGRAGIKASPYCLGAMVFGAVGDTDHDESIRGMALIRTATAFVTRHPADARRRTFRISAEGDPVLPI